MGICAKDLCELVIRPTLHHLDEGSTFAENLLLGTAAQESRLGLKMQSTNVKSDSGIHADCDGARYGGIGLFSISPATHIEVWDKFLIHHPELASRIRGLASQHQFLKSPHSELITNLAYATSIAWMIYKRHNLPLFAETAPSDLARCWLKYYAFRDATDLSITADMDVEQTLRNELLDDFTTNYRELVVCDSDDKHILAA